MFKYLFIPSHSCHSHGIINDLIYGHFFNIHIFCPKKDDIVKNLSYSSKSSKQKGKTQKNRLSSRYLLKQMLKNMPTCFLVRNQTLNPEPTAMFTSTLSSAQVTPKQKSKKFGILLWQLLLMDHLLTTYKPKMVSGSHLIGL